jgi:3-isopropylmalate/(R)-2-methylmalate dehydratase large subunit
VHEVTSPQAFTWLREKSLKVRRPERTLATMDHSTPTTPRGRDGRIPVLGQRRRDADRRAGEELRDFGIELHALGSAGQGIVHVIGPELGLTQPGAVIVCGTATPARTARSARSRSASAPARCRTCSRRRACCRTSRRRWR